MKNKKWLYVSIFVLVTVLSVSVWYFYFNANEQVSYDGTLVKRECNLFEG